MKLFLMASFLMTVVAWPAAAQSGGTGGGPAGSPPCPDVKASQVDGASKPAIGASTKKCGLGIVVFGFGGAVVGEQCPSTITYTPARSAAASRAPRPSACPRAWSRSRRATASAAA